MQRLQRRSADQLRARLLRAPSRVSTQQPGMSALGDYGENFNEIDYNETNVFRAVENPGQLQMVDANGNPIADPYNNPLSFTPYPFTLNNISPNNSGNGSIMILSTNSRRQSLIIQNLSGSAALFVNFGTPASLDIGISLGAGDGIFFDNGDKGCPNNSIFVFFNTATLSPGIIIEGVPTG